MSAPTRSCTRTSLPRAAERRRQAMTTESPADPRRQGSAHRQRSRRAQRSQSDPARGPGAPPTPGSAPPPTMSPARCQNWPSRHHRATSPAPSLAQDGVSDISDVRETHPLHLIVTQARQQGRRIDQVTKQHNRHAGHQEGAQAITPGFRRSNRSCPFAPSLADRKTGAEDASAFEAKLRAVKQGGQRLRSPARAVARPLARLAATV